MIRRALRQVRLEIADPEVETWYLWPCSSGIVFALIVPPAWCLGCLEALSP